MKQSVSSATPYAYAYGRLNLSELAALIHIYRGAEYETTAEDRQALYRCRLIEKDPAGVRVITERGIVFLGMLRGTPLPIPVTTPRWVDPREVK